MPADGTITTLFLSAMLLVWPLRMEQKSWCILVWIPWDGKGFEVFVKQDDQVKRGDLLVKFDLDTIKVAGLSTITPIVVTNTPQYLDDGYESNPMSCKEKTS